MKNVHITRKQTINKFPIPELGAVFVVDFIWQMKKLPFGDMFKIPNHESKLKVLNSYKDRNVIRAVKDYRFIATLLFVDNDELNSDRKYIMKNLTRNTIVAVEESWFNTPLTGRIIKPIK